MILLLGGSGFIGSAFALELDKRRIKYLSPRRYEYDYTNRATLQEILAMYEPEFVINAAGYTGKPNVDECELHKDECLLGNVAFPIVLAQQCADNKIPFGHVSTGCVYNGHPDDGYRESDPPNFCFTSPPCSFYSGCKALAEEILRDRQCYIWRMRMPFDHIPHSKNYITKLLTYPKLYDNVNSLSHRGQCVAACLDLWQNKSPFGTYHVTNPGKISTRDIVNIYLNWNADKPARKFKFFKDDREFYASGIAPRSNCYLNTDKLRHEGIKLPPILNAISSAIGIYGNATESAKAAK